MTSNRNKAIANKIEDKRQKEDAYHNRQSEKVAVENAASQRLSGYGSYLGGMGKLLAGAKSASSVVPSDNTLGLLSELTRSNHPIWYLDVPRIPESLSKFNFARPLGANFVFNGAVYQNGTGITIVDPTMPLSGIMVLDWEPSIGQYFPNLSTTPIVAAADSPANIAAKQLYAFVRHANSGSTNYDSPDLMQYVIGIASLWGYWMHLRTLYGLIKRAETLNDFVGRRQIEAYGYDYNDLVSHRAELFEMLEIYREKLSTFKIPSNIHILERWMFLNGTIVKDCDIVKSQFYQFKQGHVFKWNADRDGLTPQDVSNNSTYSDIIFDFNNILAAYVDAEDAGIMSGDIMHAYGKNVFTVAPVDINYTFEYLISDEVLGQIKNATIVGPITAANMAIREDVSTGRLYQGRSSDGYMTTGVSSSSFEFIFNNGWNLTFYTDAPDVSTCMVATRFTAMVERRSGTTGFACITNCGTEVITSVTIFGTTVSGTKAAITTLTANVLNPDGGANTDVLAGEISTLSQFDWHPLVYAMGEDSGDIYMYMINDIGNSFPVDRDILLRYHRTAVLSELGFREF